MTYSRTSKYSEKDRNQARKQKRKGPPEACKNLQTSRGGGRSRKRERKALGEKIEPRLGKESLAAKLIEGIQVSKKLSNIGSTIGTDRV